MNCLPSLPSNQANMASDMSSLITILVTEIRNTLNTKIDILNEKIEMKAEENRNLKDENCKLKEIIANQEKKITELQNSRQLQSSVATTDTPQTNTDVSNKSRGIKNYNLVITCPDMKGTDPKQTAEDIFEDRFRRKPKILSATILVPSESTRGPHSNTDAISEQTTEQRNVNKATRILVTLHSVWEAKAIYRERVRALKDTGIYIGEDLNKDESFMFYRARQLKKANKIISTWTENGDTYIREKLGSTAKILHPNDPILNEIKSSKNTNQAQTTPEKVNPDKPTTSKVDILEEKDPESSSSDSSINVIIDNNTTAESATTETRKSQRKRKQKKNED